MTRSPNKRHRSSASLRSLGAVRFARHARDSAPTAFTPILDALVGSVPGAYGCVIVDSLGESVDYAGRADPFELRVAGAHLQIAFAQLQRLQAGASRWLILRAARGTSVVRALPDGYALVVLLRTRVGFSASERAFLACERALAKEAGWPVSADRAWHPMHVETDKRGRPVRIGHEGLCVEVLGAIVGLAPGERGYRVRTPRGAEFSVVREGPSRWYADESPASVLLDTIPPP